MRLFLKKPTLLALAALCLGAAAAPRPLMVYTAHGPEIMLAARKSFLARHPEARIEWQALGAEEILERLGKEKDAPGADVWWGAPQFTLIRAGRAGLLAPFPKAVARQLDQASLDADGFWYGDMQTPISIVLNKQALPPGGAPADWDDLLEARFKDKIIARFPLASGTMRALYTALISRRLAAGDKLDAALAWMRRLEGQIGRYAGHSQVMFQSLGQGLFPVSFWNVPEAHLRQSQGYPIELVYPRSGLPVLVDGVALVARPAPHPLAEAFVAHVTSLALATELAAAPHYRIPTRRDLPERLLPAYLRDPRFKPMPVDWKRVASEGDRWLEAWEQSVHDRKKVAP